MGYNPFIMGCSLFTDQNSPLPRLEGRCNTSPRAKPAPRDIDPPTYPPTRSNIGLDDPSAALTVHVDTPGDGTDITALDQESDTLLRQLRRSQRQLRDQERKIREVISRNRRGCVKTATLDLSTATRETNAKIDRLVALSGERAMDGYDSNSSAGGSASRGHLGPSWTLGYSILLSNLQKCFHQKWEYII